MRVAPRILIPILTALVLAAFLVVFLWWQLQQATVIFVTEEDTPSTVVTEQPQRIDHIDPRDEALLHLRQGDLFALRGRWLEAENEYRLSVSAGGGLASLRKLAVAQLQRRENSQLRSTIRKMESLGAQSEDILLLESLVNLRTGALKQAREELLAANESPQKHYGIALLSIIEGNHDTAQSELALVSSGWEPILRSNAKIIQGAYDEFALFPESQDLHLITLLSRALAQVQECELALPLLIQVTQVRDDYRDAWIVQGYCELTTERYEQALASLERAYGLDPQKAEIQYLLARTYDVLDQYENAKTFYEYALVNGFTPEIEILRSLANAARAHSDADTAMTQYLTMTQDEDTAVEGYEGLVEVLIEQEKFEEADARAKEAIINFPEVGALYVLQAKAADSNGRPDEARAALQKALHLDPFLEEAKKMLGEME